MENQEEQTLAAAKAHFAAGRRGQAADLYKKVLEQNPESISALDGTISLTFDANKFEEAEVWLKKALELRPAEGKYWFGLGISFLRRNLWARGAEAFAKAVELLPDSLRGYCNLGICLQRIGRIDEAIVNWRRALELDPEDVDSHFQLSWVLLLGGQWEEGLKHYEWRRRFTFSRPQVTAGEWQGEDLGGKPIVLWAEQGIGDCFLCLRYVPLVARRNGRVVVCCPPSVADLVRGVEGASDVMTDPGKIAEFEVGCPLMTLPRILGTTPGNIPWNGPYLKADARAAAAWRSALKPTADLKVGLVWAGNPAHPNDWERSMSLATMQALGRVPRVTFYSLQKGRGTVEALIPPAGMKLVDLSGQLVDFRQTAAAIENLDLVIGVDTAVIHLAGAMGKPVWTLITAQPDWRWLTQGRETGWYPSMRLFRQKKMADWAPVISELASELTALAQARP